MKELSRLRKGIKSKFLIPMFAPILLGLLLLSCSKDSKEPSSLNAIDKISIDDYPEVYIEINDDTKTVELLIPFNSELNADKVKLNMQISNAATSNIDPNKEYDLSQILKIDVTAENNSIATYTLIAIKCEGGKSAVIVSDTQEDIIPLYRQDNFFVCANIVLDKAFQADVPIYYVMLKSLEGTDRWPLPNQLHYYDNGLMIDKDDVVDSFDGTILHKELLLKGISKVYVIGVSSMGCVLGTCRGTVKRKYDLILVSDAHAEPIGYRDESEIDHCNQLVEEQNLGLLIKAEDVEF